jgi:transposase
MNFLNNVYWKNGQAIDPKEKNMIIHMSGMGLNPADIASALSRDIRTVNKWLFRFAETGEMLTKKGTGRPKSTTEHEDLLINLHAIQNPKATLKKIKFEANLGCHTSTIGKILRKNKLFCRVARIKEHLSPGHKARRFQFARENLNFNFWDRTVFVDEANFMTGAAYRQLVRRPIGM